MGLIEVHLHDAEFSFAPFSSMDGDGESEPTDTDDATESNNDLYFPNDEESSDSSGFGRLLVLVVLIVAAVALRRFVGSGEDIEDFGEDDTE